MSPRFDRNSQLTLSYVKLGAHDYLATDTIDGVDVIQTIAESSLAAMAELTKAVVADPFWSEWM